MTLLPCCEDANIATPTGDSLNLHVPFFNLQDWMCVRGRTVPEAIAELAETMFEREKS